MRFMRLDLRLIASPGVVTTPGNGIRVTEAISQAGDSQQSREKLHGDEE
jgi:hypothetical protein